LFTSAAIRLGSVVTNSIRMTLTATRPTSVSCKQPHSTLVNSLPAHSSVMWRA